MLRNGIARTPGLAFKSRIAPFLAPDRECSGASDSKVTNGVCVELWQPTLASGLNDASKAAPPLSHKGDAVQDMTGADGRRGAWPLAVLLMGLFITNVDVAVVNVATPSIRDRLNASDSELQLAVSG